MGEGVEGIGVAGDGEVLAAAGCVLLLQSPALGSYGRLDAVPLPHEEVAAEELGEGGCDVVDLLVLHVQQGAHGEAHLGQLGHREVAHAVAVEEILQAFQLPLPAEGGRTDGVRRYEPGRWRRSHGGRGGPRIPFKEGGGEGVWVHGMYSEVGRVLPPPPGLATFYKRRHGTLYSIQFTDLPRGPHLFIYRKIIIKMWTEAERAWGRHYGLCCFKKKDNNKILLGLFIFLTEKRSYKSLNLENITCTGKFITLINIAWLMIMHILLFYSNKAPSFLYVISGPYSCTS